MTGRARMHLGATPSAAPLIDLPAGDHVVHAELTRDAGAAAWPDDGPIVRLWVRPAGRIAYPLYLAAVARAFDVAGPCTIEVDADPLATAGPESTLVLSARPGRTQEFQTMRYLGYMVTGQLSAVTEIPPFVEQLREWSTQGQGVVRTLNGAGGVIDAYPGAALSYQRHQRYPAERNAESFDLRNAHASASYNFSVVMIGRR